MTTKWIASAFICTGIAFACGGGSGGSGVSGNKTVVSLSDAEILDVCNYLSDLAGPERIIDCGGGTTITIGGENVAECVTDFQEDATSFPNCMATVNNLEACAEAFNAFSDAELCSETTQIPAACAPLLSAGCTGG